MFPKPPVLSPLHAYLDAIGFPWLLSREALADRYGIGTHPAYQRDVIEIETPQPFADGLLWPLSAHALPKFSSRMPAIEFFGVSHVSDDVRENLEHVRAQLALVLGPGKAASVSNCIMHRWLFGMAGVELHAWPPELQRHSGRNPFHEREPRLKTACSISVFTGYRLPLSSEERALIKAFQPIFRAPGDVNMRSGFRASPSELEFIRVPEPDFSKYLGWIGCSSDRSALICFYQELYVIPLAEVLRFELERVLPAKGKGGAGLRVVCRCNHEDKSFEICSAPGADDLTELACRMADALGKPLNICQYVHDV